MSQQVINGPRHIPGRPVGGQGVHQLPGLVHLGVAGQLTVVEVGGEGDKPLDS